MKSKYLSFKAVIILIVSFISHYGVAQNIQWQKTLGGTLDEETYSVQVTSDGGYILVGGTISNNGDVSGNHGSYDIWVVKTTSTGAIQWQKTLGGTEEEKGYSIQVTSDGGYILVGKTSSNNGDVSGQHGSFGYDIWVVKLSSTGSIEWQKALGGSNSEEGKSIQPTSDGGYILTGYTQSNDGDVTGNHGGTDVWVVKLNATGTIEWQKTLGGTNEDFGASIQTTLDGGYIVAGSTRSNDGDVIGNHSPSISDGWVVKITSTGVIQWQKTLGGTEIDNITSIQTTSDGGYVLTGHTYSNNGDISVNMGMTDIWVAKLSSIGGIEWQKSFGGTSFDYGHCIQQTTDGGYILSASTDSNNGDIIGHHGVSDVWVAKLSSVGGIEWKKTLGGTAGEDGYFIRSTSDGGYILANGTSSNNGDVSGSHGGREFWLVKLSGGVEIVETIPSIDLTVSPNPVLGGNFIVNYNLIQSSTVEITVLDVFGKIVLKEMADNLVGLHQKELKLDGVASGIYSLHIKTKYGKATIRLLKAD